MDFSEIKTVEDLADYISLYKASIYVRVQVDSEWGSFPLNELPADLAIDHALRFIKEGRIPVRLKEG